MRRLQRLDLSPQVQTELDRKQEQADERKRAGDLDVGTTWKNARQTNCLKATLKVLKQMAGKTERCMYCSDSRGADIEHIWPKERFPERMFRWPNMLLCCTECGRFKGDRLEVEGDRPVFVDPTSDDPWEFLDFDPITGNITAKFDKHAGQWSAKGTQTVEILRLDRREALSAVYKRVLRRLETEVNNAISEQNPDINSILERLQLADDCGLLGWCFSDFGSSWSIFAELRGRFPELWQVCRQLFCKPHGPAMS
jgi:uncharacterized protein (TIGR02646 family)